MMVIDRRTRMNSSTPKRRTSLGRAGLIMAGVTAVLSIIIMSCSTVNRSVVMLPQVPGASYIGSAECEQCHEDVYKTFPTADHFRLMAQGENMFNAGCESCHGPGSLHAESGGEVLPPYSFTAGRPAASSFTAHLAAPPARTTETVCFQCHPNVRGEFNLPNHHPLPEGQMTCSECHDPHKGSAHLSGGTALRTQNDHCLSCHPAQHGPYVFEHEAMREGCTACHMPHGSVNAKLLSVRDSNLCLKCHFQRVQGGNIMIGGSIHAGSVNRLQQGSCWTAGCHEAVHGSRVSSSLRF